MKLGRTRSSLQAILTLLYLVWSVSLVSVSAAADSSLDPNRSAEEWKKIFGNKDVCGLKQWMETDCQPDAGTGGGQAKRRDFYGRDDANFTASSCTCTLPFYNIWCGCNLMSNTNTSGLFNTWSAGCKASNFSTDGSINWLFNQRKDIPGWAFTKDDGGSFNTLVVSQIALSPQRWSVVQIIVPVVVAVSTIFLSGVILFYWRRYHILKSKGKANTSFLAYVGSLFKRRAPSIVRQSRNDTWVIDGHREQVVNDSGGDTDSLFMRQPPSLVESPRAEFVSRWSPTDTSVRSPPSHTRSNTGVYSFNPRQRHPSIEQRMFGTSTIRSFGDRVKHLLPWVGGRPVPVNNILPGSDYRIDPANRSTRTATLSTLSSKRGKGGYETISEDAGEDVDPIGTGRTRVGAGRREMVATITEEERAAVAGSVILIGDQDFTLESGSTGHSQRRQSTPRVANFRGRAATEDIKSPSLRYDVSVEPPSPTLESMQIRSPPPKSPGAPPLLPPAPQERPPLPPPVNRSTPRRTPSPHLRISTQFDGNPLNLSKSNLSKAVSHETISGLSQSIPRISPPNPQLGHHLDPLGSGGSASGTHALSYVTLPGVSRSHSPSQSDGLNNIDHLTTGDDALSSNRRRSGSGSRPLPPQPPEPSGPAPLAPALTHQISDISTGLQPVPSGAMTNIRPLSSSSTTTRTGSQQSEFDPYKDSGIPRPIILQPNRHPDAQRSQPYTHDREHSSSSASLPRPPGDPVGQLQRGWSADDDMDRASLLMDQPPMQVDDGMSGSRGVYVAAPRDAMTLGDMPTHSRVLSIDSFVTAIGDSDTGGNGRNSHRFSSGGTGEEGSPTSPTLSMLQADPRSQASYAGRRSISGSSGWDASTHITQSTNSPIELPLPISGRTPNFNPRPLPPTGSPSSTVYRNLSPQPSPRPSHARLGSETSLIQSNRSREDILNPARNDPVRLFPASVRSAGYTTGLSPDSVPIPPLSRSHTPRPSESSAPRSGHTPNNSTGSSRSVTGSGPLAGYVEMDRTQVSVGGTWGTDSSGIQSVLESIQRLPDAYPHDSSSSSNKRTP
ncbi:hypothetical protein D9756_010381 [Leucocoprinus leucothites]|uniref:Uncharacterized protein n=1 Tax=Leucocoprinus leucothites TaxID=201217 RepID=A0A8H5FS43_9AGAR|nr:hypothetical protein D9756_010381 [Leucoagaricus leucothites]